MVTGSNAKTVPDNTEHESFPGTRVVRGLEFLDNPEEKKRSVGVILKFMPFKKIRFKPTQKYKTKNSAHNPNFVELKPCLYHYFLTIPTKNVK